MVEETVVKNWSEAFFMLVLETKKVKQYRDEAGVLIDIFACNQEFIDLLKSSNLPFQDKEKIIKNTFSDFSVYMVNFLLLLAENKHFQYVRLILKALRRECNAFLGIEYGTVYSVIPLTKTQMHAIQKKIAAFTKSIDVELVNKIDKSLIGGLKVKLKKQVFDGSIKGRIDNLKAKLSNNHE